MRRIALFAVVATTMAWAGATAFGVVGCSSDPAATADAGPKKGTSTSSSSGDDDDNNGSTTSSTSGSTTSSTGGTDGGADASTSSGGALGSNALKITCKATDCTTDGEGSGTCCWTDGKQDQAACGVTGEGCGDNFNGFNISCDEKADCKAGVCCWGNGQTECSTKCADVQKPEDNPNQPDIQLCKTDAECGGAVKCTKKTCGFGEEGAADADLIKATISVCGTPTNCK